MPTGKQRLCIRGVSIDPDEIYMTFVGDLLLDVGKPHNDTIFQLNFSDAISPENAFTVVCRSGLLAHRDAGAF